MPSITKHELQRLQERDKRLTEKMNQEMCKEFVDLFTNNMMTLLASTPFAKWPNEARVAFSAAQQKAPTAAHLYIQSLPSGYE